MHKQEVIKERRERDRHTEGEREMERERQRRGGGGEKMKHRDRDRRRERDGEIWAEENKGRDRKEQRSQVSGYKQRHASESHVCVLKLSGKSSSTLPCSLSKNAHSSSDRLLKVFVSETRKENPHCRHGQARQARPFLLMFPGASPRSRRRGTLGKAGEGRRGVTPF